jgi:hypothetical protein
MCRVGYKYYAGSYWRRIDDREASKTNRQIVNDKDGIWEKVSLEEATFELEIVDEPTRPQIVTLNLPILEAEICPNCGAKTLTFRRSPDVDYEFYKCSNNACNRVYGVDELRILRSKVKAPKVAIQPQPSKINPDKPAGNNPLVAPKSPIQPVETKSAEHRPHPSFWEDVKRMVLGTQVSTRKNFFKEEKKDSVAWFGNQYFDPKTKKWKDGPKGRRV